MTWQASIDARLVARLTRALRPGLLRMDLARRIVDGVEAMAGRLPLLARFPRVVEGKTAGATPIVHARWPAPPAGEGERAAVVASAGERKAAPGEHVRKVVSARSVERERRIERTIVERVSVPLAATAERATPEPAVRTESIARPAPDSPESPDSHDSHDSPVRRSRMGAPLAVTSAPHIASLGSLGSRGSRGAMTALAVTSRPRIASPAVVTALAVTSAPHIASPAAMAGRSTHTLANHPGSALDPPPARQAGPVAASGTAPALVMPGRVRRALPGAAAPHVVAPNGSGRRATPGQAVVLPARPAATQDAAPRDPLVVPRRSRPATHTAGPPLAHVAPAPAAAPSAAATATPPGAPIAARAQASPAAPPVPRAAAAATPSIGAPLSRTDLPEIAARVQHILEHQAFHERARRGLRR